MLSCLGFRKSRQRDAEREPLLPQYNDDTSLQTRLHEKLHTYQMLRALSKGFMPSNEQAIVHLRCLLSADILNPQAARLSTSGRALIRCIRMWIQQFIDLLHHKNSNDQLQDFIWCLAKARLAVDVGDIRAQASQVKLKADAAATYQSLRTVGSLLLTNSDFRVFLSDLTTVSKEVFRDTAFTLADVSTKAGKRLEPSDTEIQKVKSPNGKSHETPTTEDLQNQVTDVSQVVAEGATEVLQETQESVVDHLSGEERNALIERLKQAVLELRHRRDYSESVSTLSLLLRRYLLSYSHAAVDVVKAAEEDVEVNDEADDAVREFWSLVTSVGNRDDWKQVEDSFKSIIDHGRVDPKFDELVEKLSALVQEFLTDPRVLDNSKEQLDEVREKYQELSDDSPIAEDLKTLLTSLKSAVQSVENDEDITRLLKTSSRILHTLSPTNSYINNDLVADSIHVFVPLLIQAIQYIPIPRVEVSTPAIDILLESLVLEPGKSVNHTSFLPYRLHVSSNNDVDICKNRSRITTTLTNLVTVKVAGLSIAAEGLGYWLRAHSGLLRFVDEGLVDFHLDRRGMDVTLDLEIGQDRLEKVVSLHKAHVKIHRLDYDLSKSKFSCLAWILKPFIRPIVKKALEIKIAGAIEDGLHTLNRELLYARERLRATRIADPDDLWTFIRAVSARLVPAPDPNIEARVGITPGGGVFEGKYAPGSLVQLWDNEARDAEGRIQEFERDGWRNGIFDMTTV